MPQIKTKSPTKSRKVSAYAETDAPLKSQTAAPKTAQRPTATDARDLISKMLDYESAAQNEGINLSSGRFEMLTASERQFYRAELIADYIRLSAGNLGNTQFYYESALTAFCNKICDMKIPSHELIGTYLASVDLVAKEDDLTSVPHLGEAVRRTMKDVLQSCVSEMKHRSELAA